MIERISKGQCPRLVLKSNRPRRPRGACLGMTRASWGLCRGPLVCPPLIPPPPRVTFRRVVAPLRGPGQSPVLPFACCVGSLRSDGRCGRCSCWCRCRVRGAQWLVCRGCAGCGGMCRLRVSPPPPHGHHRGPSSWPPERTRTSPALRTHGRQATSG